MSFAISLAVAALLAPGEACPWERQSPTPSGDHINGVSFVSPDLGYVAGDDRMLMRTTDGGTTWAPLPGWERWPYYEGAFGDVYFIDAQHGWIGGAFADHFQRTSDGGASWQPMPFIGYVYELRFLSTQVGYARTNSGIEKSTDGGASWSLILQHAFPGTIAAMSWWDETRGIAARAERIDGVWTWSLHRTVDGGASWTQVQSDNEFYGVTFVDRDTVVWGTFAGDVCRSEDFGSTYTVVTAEPNGVYAAARVDSDSVAIMDYDYAFWISDDRGDAWKRTHDGIQLRVAESFPKMRFFDDRHGWATGENGLLWRTDDGGHSWRQASQGMGRDPSDIHMYADGRGFMAGDLLLLRTDDYGAHWRSLAPLIGRQGGQLIRNLDTAGVATIATLDGRASLLISQDRGDAWDRFDLPDPPQGFQRYLMWVDFVTPDVGFVFGFYLECCGVVYKTTDGGETWQGPEIFDDAELKYGQMFDAQAGVALMANNRRILRTDDAWHTVTSRTIPGSLWTRLAFATPEIGWAGNAFGHVARTTNAGDTWIESTPPEAYPGYSIQDFHVVSPDELYALGAPNTEDPEIETVRVWHSTDGGATWTIVGHDVSHPDDPSITSADAIAVLPGTGVWTAGFNGFIVSNVVTPNSSDIDGDGRVDFADLLLLLGSWGTCGEPCNCPADLNGDGDVGLDDLLLVLTDWTG